MAIDHDTYEIWNQRIKSPFTSAAQEGLIFVRAKGCGLAVRARCRYSTKWWTTLQKVVLGSVGAQREWKKEQERLSVPWKSHQHITSRFQLSALFSRIIDGACEAQRTWMKMSQSLGSKTRAMAQDRAGGKMTHAVFIAAFNMRKEWKKNGSDLQSGAT